MDDSDLLGESSPRDLPRSGQIWRHRVTGEDWRVTSMRGNWVAVEGSRKRCLTIEIDSFLRAYRLQKKS